MDYLLAILNATLCVHATEHNIYRVTQIEFKKMDEVGYLSFFANNTKFRKLSICITD